MISEGSVVRTAAYCRVSTDKEAQSGSYEMQEEYFTNYIRSNPNMELVGIYGDKGKSGLRMEGRPGLHKLLEDCRAGRIDLILTKSISRFTRNMAECADMIRELRKLGVYIQFEKENLNTKDTKCDLILNIFSAIAQEESNSISLNTRRSHEQYTLEGRPYGRISFGYRNAGNNKWAIDEETAPKVRMAFQMASEGKNYTEILCALNKEEQEIVWSQKRLKRMLRNPAYKGDYYSHGTVCLIPGKPVSNRGYRDRFYIKGHHEPIVPPAVFDMVQEIMARGILISYKNLTEEDKVFLKKVEGVWLNAGCEKCS